MFTDTTNTNVTTLTVQPTATYTLIPGATAPLNHQFLVLGCGALILPLLGMLIYSFFTYKGDNE